MSIPRLELQGALLASRLSATLRAEHETQWEGTTYWTDSNTVLQWIRSEAGRFKPFVAHRVGEIHELTDTSQWRWVPTRENVADDATRGLTIDELTTGRWTSGPGFLKLPPQEWPEESAADKDGSDVGSEEVTLHDTQESFTDFSEELPDVNRFSSWYRLIRATAWSQRFVSNLKKKVCGGEPVRCELSVTEIRNAEKLWWRAVQSECFSAELKSLKKQQPVDTSSRLVQLCPVLDEHGVMRSASRLQRSSTVAKTVL